MSYDNVPQIEDSNLRKMNRDGKRPRSDEQSQLKSKKRFFNQDYSMGNKDKVSNKNSEGSGYAYERPMCTSCGKQHLDRCHSGTDGCFGCVNTGHKMRYFPTHKGKEKEVNEAPHDYPYPNAPKRNRFYALRAKEASNKK